MLMYNKRKQPLAWYRDPDLLIDPKTGNEVIFLSDGHLELHHCKTAHYVRAGDHKLFCSGNRRWFHLFPNGALTEEKHTFSLSNRTPGMHCHNGDRGNDYPCMRQWGARSCHSLAYEAWHGERHWPQKEIDHKNGDPMDYTPDNLEEVTPSENRWRSFRVLKPLRAKVINPATYTGLQMDHWFAIVRFLDKELPLHWQTFTREDYMCFFVMPFEEFKAEMIKGLGKLVGPEQMMKDSFYDKD